MQEIELIQQAKNGSTSCFTQLVVLYQQRLYSYLLTHCQNHADADDICQDTFISAYKYLNSYNEKWAFSTWLFTIAKRRLSQTKKHKHLSLDDLQETEASTSDSDAIPEVNIWQTVKKHLSPESHDLLWFFYIEEYRVKEIAHIMKKSESWVKTNLHRSKMKLSNIPSLKEMMGH